MSSYQVRNLDTGDVSSLSTSEGAVWDAVSPTGDGWGLSPLAALAEAVDNGMPYSTALHLANILGDWTRS